MATHLVFSRDVMILPIPTLHGSNTWVQYWEILYCRLLIQFHVSKSADSRVACAQLFVVEVTIHHLAESIGKARTKRISVLRTVMATPHTTYMLQFVVETLEYICVSKLSFLTLWKSTCREFLFHTKQPCSVIVGEVGAIHTICQK